MNSMIDSKVIGMAYKGFLFFIELVGNFLGILFYIFIDVSKKGVYI